MSPWPGKMALWNLWCHSGQDGWHYDIFDVTLARNASTRNSLMSLWPGMMALGPIWCHSGQEWCALEHLWCHSGHVSVFARSWLNTWIAPRETTLPVPGPLFSMRQEYWILPLGLLWCHSCKLVFFSDKAWLQIYYLYSINIYFVCIVQLYGMKNQGNQCTIYSKWQIIFFVFVHI